MSNGVNVYDAAGSSPGRLLATPMALEVSDRQAVKDTTSSSEIGRLSNDATSRFHLSSLISRSGIPLRVHRHSRIAAPATLALSVRDPLD